MPKQVTIEKLVFGGYGLARTDKGVIFVTGVIPGETVTIEPFAKKGGSTIARPVEIIESSPARRTPPCPLAGRCGGCDWLHIAYHVQCKAKQDIVHDCMTRIGHLKALPDIETISADEFSYRHRCQIKISPKGNAGFFARSTNELVTVTACPLLVPALNTLLADLEASPVPQLSNVENLMLMAGDRDTVASSPVIPGSTTTGITLTVDNKKFMVQANGFFQSNRPLLRDFGAWARPFIGGNFFIDLYGGSGFFSIMLADRFKQGLLIESVNAQVLQAQDNFKRNGCTHIAARAGRAEDISRIVDSRKIDCLIVDPPRPGLSRKTCESIARLAPQSLLYISCNPSTQARDLGFLVTKAGYTIKKTALFDLYPNTHHIESVALLERQ
jgi:23S rRNA (uracil1939-C5)-methyltransferase